MTEPQIFRNITSAILKMQNIDFVNCLKIEISHDMSASTMLDLSLLKCSLWDETLSDLISSWHMRPVCPYNPSAISKIDKCGNGGVHMGYMIGRYGVEEVDCQCDVYCESFQDCCEDYHTLSQYSSKETNAALRLSQLTNFDQLISYTSNQIPPWNRTNPFGYFMVTDCPTKRHHLRDHCRLTIPEQVMNLYHFTPVEVQGMVYRNIFCAWCRGIQNVSKDNLWLTYFKGGRDCVLGKVFPDTGPVPFPQLFKVCIPDENGITGPLVNGVTDIDRGLNRMGKLCLINEPKPHEEKRVKEKFLDLEIDENSFAKTYRNCIGAINVGVDSTWRTFNFLLAKTIDGFNVVRHINLTAMCTECPPLMQQLLTDYAMEFQDSLIPPKPLTPNSSIPLILNPLMVFYSGLLIFFDSPDIVIDSDIGVNFTEADMERKSYYQREDLTKDVAGIISRVGCILSVISLFAIFFMWRKRNTFCQTEAKRVQFLLILSKMVFFLVFLVGVCLEMIEMACRIVGMILHSTLLLSFSWTILFSVKVLRMMINLKYDMAALAVENKGEKSVKVKEMLQYIVIFFFAIAFGVAAGVVEVNNADREESFFGYGDGVCFATTRNSQLFFVVIPTGITTLVNSLMSITSVWLMWQITHDMHDNNASAHSLLAYLFRLLVFQSIQWLFGLIYFFCHNQAVGLIFTFLSSFEGVFTLVAVFTSKS